MSQTDRAGFPWSQAALLALPSVILAGIAGAVGAATPVGLVLLAAAVGFLAVDLVWIQPKFDFKLLLPGTAEQALEGFLEAASTVDSIEEVAEELSVAANRVSGEPVRVALVAPHQSAGIRVVSPSPYLNDIDLGHRASAFAWLGDSIEPLWRSQLDGIPDTGATDTAEMMDLVNAKVLVPLRHRGDLLGLVLLDSHQFRRTEQVAFLKGLRTHATTALANTFLGAEAEDRLDVAKTLGLANAIQESLMPEERPVRRRRWELRGLFRPVADCGGDLWGWRELGPDKILLVVADATGHGAGPALLSAVAKGTMDAHAQMTGVDCDPSELLSALNKAILRVGQRVFMMTAFAIVVDIRKREMKYANAGQNFPFLIRNDNLEALVVRGDQLGVREDPSFVTHTKAILPGDKILMYTDGIVEAGEPVSEPFGERRFRKLVQSMGPVAASNIPLRIFATVEAFLEGQAIHDDVTLVAFEFLAEESAPL